MGPRSPLPASRNERYFRKEVDSGGSIRWYLPNIWGSNARRACAAGKTSVV